jgi:hypothetical protein
MLERYRKSRGPLRGGRRRFFNPARMLMSDKTTTSGTGTATSEESRENKNPQSPAAKEVF